MSNDGIDNDDDDKYTHGPVPANLECLVTMEDIDETNYVEYQSHPSGVWQAAKMEESVIQQLLSTQFHEYLKKVQTSDCQAELRRLLSKGPPVFVSDPHGLPLAQESDTHVSQLWYSSSNTTLSAKLDGAVQGSGRMELWESLKEFLIEQGKEPGDDEEEENEKEATTGNDGGSSSG